MGSDNVWTELLGTADLLGQGGATVNPSTLGEKKCVALYFSAHWCPPCRGFTPKLAEYYKADLQNKGLEIVFVSSDKDDEAFQSYFKEMPWLALPFSARELKTQLSSKFKVSGIPALIILGPDGKVITTEGRARCMEDPKGEELPWKPKSLTELLTGEYQDKTGTKFKLEDFEGKKLGIYFSAHWCPPCRSFTPKLAETYKKLQDKGEKFEILFASSDKSEDEFQSYLNDMPWKAIPFADSKRKAGLSNHFNVSGIPTLVILDENRKVINESAVGKVRADGEFPWAPDLVREIDEDCDSIYSIKSIVCLQEMLSPEQQQKNKEIMAILAQKYKDEQAEKDADDVEFIFFAASKEGQLSKRVRDECNQKEKFVLLCMDISDNGAYYVSTLGEQLSEEALQKFCDDVKAGNVERGQMGE